MNNIEFKHTEPQRQPPKKGDVWVDTADNFNVPYIIVHFQGKLYAVALSCGNIYTHNVDQGPFGTTEQDFVKLNGSIILTPEQ